MDIRDKFLNKLEKKLDPTQKKLFNLIHVERRKDSLVFRMPIGYIALTSIWEKIEEVSAETSIRVSKADVFATLSELDELLGDIEWLWEGWIPKGFVTMIAGDPGIGKSAIAQHLVKTVTEGGTFPLCTEPLGEPRNAVWIDTESAQQIIKVRAGTMKMDKSRVYIPSFDGDILTNTNLGQDDHREHIVNLIEGTDPALVILDSLGSSHSRGENKVEEMRPLMTFLSSMARDYQLAMVIVHHLNKDRKGEEPEITLNRVRGNTVITANCRSIFTVEPSMERSLRLRVIKNNLALIGDPIMAIPLLDERKQFTGFDYRPYVAPPPKKNRKDICADWILETLSKTKGGGLDLTDLIELGAKAGFTRSNIYSSRDLLDDRVMYSGTGKKAHWSLTREDQVTMKKILSNGKVKHGKKSK